MFALNMSSRYIIMTPQKIKNLRKDIGDTQKNFAKRLGFTSYITVSRWERGIQKPNPSALILLEQLQKEVNNGKN